ncbi:hypothetical protein J6A31_04840 [bacterium]|nr:hypothetical protein [bacterium]
MANKIDVTVTLSGVPPVNSKQHFELRQNLVYELRRLSGLETGDKLHILKYFCTTGNLSESVSSYSYETDPLQFDCKMFEDLSSKLPDIDIDVSLSKHSDWAEVTTDVSDVNYYNHIDIGFSNGIINNQSIMHYDPITDSVASDSVIELDSTMFFNDFRDVKRLVKSKVQSEVIFDIPVVQDKQSDIQLQI